MYLVSLMVLAYIYNRFSIEPNIALNVDGSKNIEFQKSIRSLRIVSSFLKHHVNLSIILN